jgi:shikimate dehydrogenase
MESTLMLDAQANRSPLVNGKTKLFGVVGDPIGQVRSPEVFSAMFRAHGINAMSIPYHVAPGDLATFFAGLRHLKNLQGLIITIPHKLAAVEHVDELTDRAKFVRSINFIMVKPDGRWVGDIVDGMGFVSNLRANGVELEGRRALLVGTGGVGTAIAFALIEAGVAELSVYDLDRSRASRIAADLPKGRVKAVDNPDPRGFDLVVNATPVGMKAGDPFPIDPEAIDPLAVVADVIVERTRFLNRAAERGCVTYPGAGMMKHQLAVMAKGLGYADYDFSPEFAAAVSGDIESMPD